VVLRSDLNGRVRVISPVDPSGDQHVDGGKKYELKGRGGREAFVAEDTTGQGTVLAAWSRTPFTFDRYVKDGRWDLDALAGEGLQPDDAEAHLTEIVNDMQAPGGHYEYDLAVYTVMAPRYARATIPTPIRTGSDIGATSRGGGSAPHWGARGSSSGRGAGSGSAGGSARSAASRCGLTAGGHGFVAPGFCL
jgi:hypothetical protein